MVKHFGELAFVRGIIYYKLSPHEQKPFAGAISYGAPNMIPRTTATIAYWLPAFVTAIVVYRYIEDRYYHSKRKNIKDYENEVDPDPCKTAKALKELNKPGKKP